MNESHQFARVLTKHVWSSLSTSTRHGILSPRGWSCHYLFQMQDCVTVEKPVQPVTALFPLDHCRGCPFGPIGEDCVTTGDAEDAATCIRKTLLISARITSSLVVINLHLLSSLNNKDSFCSTTSSLFCLSALGDQSM